MKIYILYHNDPKSIEYANFTAHSCQQVGMEYELVEGFSSPMDPNEAWNSIGLKNKVNRVNRVPKAQLCSAGHAKIWKMIADSGEDGIVLEHDAVMLHNIDDIELPEDTIVVLGYKVKDPQNYNHEKAGPPDSYRVLTGHEGAHAYAITPKTAQKMFDELDSIGIWSAVDNQYFLRDQRKSKTNIAILDPTPAIGWLRDSTIWGNPAEVNYEFIDSFKQNYIRSGA